MKKEEYLTALWFSKLWQEIGRSLEQYEVYLLGLHIFYDNINNCVNLIAYRRWRL